MGIAAGALANFRLILLPLLTRFIAAAGSAVASFGAAFLPSSFKADIVLFDTLPFAFRTCHPGGFTMLLFLKRLAPVLKGR